MKQEINLLPPAYQAERQTHLYLSRVGRILRRVDAILILIVVVLVLLYGMFEFIQRKLDQQRTVTQEADVTFEQTITQANMMIETVKTRGQDYSAWTPHVEELLFLLPPELKLTRLAADEQSSVIILSGTFRERDAVVQYEKAIEKVSWVEKVESPLQNLASGNKAEFTITVTRKKARPL